VAPLSAFASYQIQPQVWLHGEATYNMVFASGSGDLRKTTLGATAAAQSVQLGLMGEYRIRPDIAITLRGRLQVFTSKLAASGSSNPDAFTSINVDARLTPHSYPWEIVPGVSFLWTRVRLSAGVGYGNYFVPNMDIARGTKSIVPEANFAVLF